MLKRLAILVMLLTFAQVPLPMKGDNQQNQPQDKTGKTDPDAQAAATAEVNKENAANAERYAYYKAHPEEYFRGAFAPANLSNWILAGLGTVGGIMALCTLLVIKKQTDHIAASERAWLIARSAMKEGYRPYGEDKPIFRWSITNTGKTVARVIEAQCVYQLLNIEQLQQLPAEPVYHLPTQFNRMPLPPSDSVTQSANLIHPPESSAVEHLGDDVKVIQLGLFFLLAFGYVKYLDAFNNERESRFIEKYIWPSPGIRQSGFRPYLDAPPPYTNCT